MAFLYQHISNSYVLLKKAIFYATVVSLIPVSLGGVTFWTARAAQQTRIQGTDGVMLSKNNLEPVAVGQVEVEAPVGALAYLLDTVPPHVTHIQFLSKDRITTFHRKVTSVDVVSHMRERIKTVDGDSLYWDKAAGNKLFILTEDKTWATDVGCEACSAINLYADEDVLEAIDEFYQDVGQGGDSD